MKRFLKLCVKALVLSTVLIVPLSGAALAADNPIDMVVSPNVLNIESHGGSVSIHTDFGYVAPADATLEVDGTLIEQITTFTDATGHLVVKCSIETVKDIVTIGEDAVFVLTCNCNGAIYSGTDTVSIIQVIPQKP